MGEFKVDFVLITAIELERQAICRAFGMGDKDRVDKSGRTYWKTQLDLGDRQFYQIVVTQLPDAAGVDAALAANTAINDWQPEVVLMVGIAGAARENIQLGDLVLGKEVYYYERGKDSLTGRLPEPKQYPANATLWNKVITMGDEKLARWKSSLPLRPDGTDACPDIRQGVIASGERVIANAEIRDEIAANNRKIDAIEMEGYGVTAAAWKQDQPVRCLVIRAISDRADAQKNDVWQPYAAVVAAEFTKYFLLDRPLSPQNPPHPPPSSPSRFRLIIEDTKNGNLVPFLGPGINSNFYIDLALKLAECVQKNLLMDGGEHNTKHERLIQTLIGIPCSVCHYWPQDRPPECPMLKNIDGEKNIKNCPLYIEQGLAVSKINLRYLSQYYILRNDVTNLYSELYEILSDLEKSHQPDVLHHFVAKLPRLMLARNYPRRSPGLPFQLVVTTNYDDMLEQAFLAAQQPFDVVFYIADGDNQGKFMHQPYQGLAEIIGVNESARLPLRSPWGNSPQPRPIILKLFGTWENNFVATEEQMAYLISTLKTNLPASLISILTKSNVLFMGYSPSDSDLQLLMNCFWPNNRIPGKSWLLHQAKPGDLEQEIWKTRNVELLDIPSSDDFVGQLEKVIEAQPVQ